MEHNPRLEIIAYQNRAVRAMESPIATGDLRAADGRDLVHHELRDSCHLLFESTYLIAAIFGEGATLEFHVFSNAKFLGLASSLRAALASVRRWRTRDDWDIALAFEALEDCDAILARSQHTRCGLCCVADVMTVDVKSAIGREEFISKS